MTPISSTSEEEKVTPNLQLEIVEVVVVLVSSLSSFCFVIAFRTFGTAEQSRLGMTKSTEGW
jgi:hypothetical protein